MRVFSSIAKLHNLRQGDHIFKDKKIGFVPTMGALHQGHISLVERAKKECDLVFVSIFVNPTQFAPHEDLQKYPRPLHDDIRLLESANADCLFIPTPEEMYPKDVYSTYVDVGFDHTREGKARPGHFRGVATVVTKLFNIVQPHTAFFGQKDAIQCMVIRRFVQDLNIPVNVMICPTLREDDGLAMSSRNRYLSPDERKIAPLFSKALFHGKDLYLQGERSSEKIMKGVRKILDQEKSIKYDYISLDDFNNGYAVEENIKGEALLSGAIFLGKTRLIDNVILSESLKD